MAILVLGLDVGGANLKAARNDGTARSRAFALWQQPARLAPELQLLVQGWSWDRVALTMTGELCDCFATRRDGVRAILEAVNRIQPARPIRVWTVDGRFDAVEAIEREPLRAAAANWLAAATWVARWIGDGSAVFVDVGSTTTDVIPLDGGIAVPRGRTDEERLDARELVYTGVRRTPVHAVLGFEVMAELFATTLDVGLVRGTIAEDDGNMATADGRPADRAHAHARLARMLGGDGETVAPGRTRALADRVWQRQVAAIAAAIVTAAGRLSSAPGTFVVAGEGEALARAAIRAAGHLTEPVSLADRLGPERSAAVCATAVAELLIAEGPST
jgi:hypothetical protein